MAVGGGALVAPGVEDGADGEQQLGARVLGEVLAGRAAVGGGEAVGELAQGRGAELAVGGRSGTVTQLGERVLEQLRGHAADDLAEHLQQPAARVASEALVAAACQPGDGVVGEPEVEDRVEHPRHRDWGPGADREQQRVGGIPEPATLLALERLDSGVNLGLEAVRKIAGAHVLHARGGRDREPARHPLGSEHPGHLRQVGALVAEELTHLGGAVGERVDPARLAHVATGANVAASTSSATSSTRAGDRGRELEAEAEACSLDSEHDQSRGSRPRLRASSITSPSPNECDDAGAGQISIRCPRSARAGAAGPGARPRPRR